ncbi:O-antigen ligase family protein [Microcella sp.]|uniref:O-antigen ligase family protein n=1 Tax=Microcella sp. TaxID=1913979 RepID=UPI002560EA51|nr:O-antigen ligase family protein [Microcella sp.]MBX9472741.1 O-antigen ligase family protein [Microcella sp.]
MTWLRERRVALAAFTFFTLLAGDAWRNTISWYGWGLIALVIIVLWGIVAFRLGVDLRRIPIALGALLGLMAASIVWSYYPGATAVGLLTTGATAYIAIVMAHTVSLAQLLRSLGVALRFIIGLSLAFELFVAAVLQRPVLPFWVSWEEPFPKAFYWSRALLFEGGRIQGIPGNANLLAFAALLGVIVFSIQLAERRVGAAAGWGWLAASLATLALTRSSTVLVAGAAALVAFGVIVLARRLSARGKLVLSGVTAVAAAGVVALALTFREPLLALVGRSDDLTGRLDIWAAVIGLAEQRPVLGWGWVSYWAPWVEPFDDLVVINGVTYLQAHNAWLDVLMQLGWVGLIVFTILIVTTGARVLSWSVDAPLGDAAPTAALRLLPALLLTVLLVHSLAESRLLIEAGLALLVYLAVASRVRGLTIAASRVLPTSAPVTP